MTLLSKQYGMPVGVELAVPVPASYVLMGRWRRGVTSGIEIGIGRLVAAGGVALFVALATVSTQAVRAARLDLAQTLRSE